MGKSERDIYKSSDNGKIIHEFNDFKPVKPIIIQKNDPKRDSSAFKRQAHEKKKTIKRSDDVYESSSFSNSETENLTFSERQDFALKQSNNFPPIDEGDVSAEQLEENLRLRGETSFGLLEDIPFEVDMSIHLP